MKIKSDIPGVILGLSPVVGLGISGGLQDKIKERQQATIGGLTAEQIEVLKKEPDLEDIVPYKHSDSFLMNGNKFEAVYMPNGFGIIKSYELVSGICPEQYNEIVINKNVQLELGYQLNIGDTITLPTADISLFDKTMEPVYRVKVIETGILSVTVIAVFDSAVCNSGKLITPSRILVFSHRFYSKSIT
jgi:hypothetical protein